MIRGILSCVAVVTFSLTALAADKTVEAKKPEPKPAVHAQRPSNVVFILIETSEFDAAAKDELQRMYDMLRKLDKDQSGKIDAAALQEARTQIVEDRADDIIHKLDADKDGRISHDEAKGRILEHFDHIDADKDGFIDRAELIQAITARVQNAPK